MKTLKTISIHIIILTVFLVPFVIYAQGAGGSNTGGTPASSDTVINIPNPAVKAGNSVMSVITTLLQNVVMPVAAVAVVMWIIWAGFSYVLAQGKPAEIQKAHSRLLWSLVGAGILLGSAGIAKVVENTVNSLK